jgi:hypothetical protein
VDLFVELDLVPELALESADFFALLLKNKTASGRSVRCFSSENNFSWRSFVIHQAVKPNK